MKASSGKRGLKPPLTNSASITRLIESSPIVRSTASKVLAELAAGFRPISAMAMVLLPSFRYSTDGASSAAMVRYGSETKRYISDS